MNQNTLDIYIDEAGNTGADLLNAEQRAFVLASSCFSEAERAELKSLFSVKDELHFVGLKNSQSGREALVRFINHSLISENKIQCVIAHKPFVVAGHLVDRLIEPVLHIDGKDIYQYGDNIWYANYIFHAGNAKAWDGDLYDQLLHGFMAMARTKTPQSILQFFSVAESLRRTVPERDRIFLSLILGSREHIEDILSQIDKFALDVTLTSFYMLCELWHRRAGTKLRIFQDDSKQISHYREHIDFTTQMKIEQQKVGFDDRSMTYPTQIEELNMVSSKNVAGVQVSDLIASTIAFMYNNKNSKHLDFVTKIQESKLINLENHYTIWPSGAEELLSRKMEGNGQNPLDFLAAQFLKGKN